MNLTSLALLLVLLAMLFAIFTQRLLLSTNTDIYDPIATKLEDVRNGFSGMKESIVSKLDHYRDIIVDNGKDLSITPSRLQHSSLQQEITETEDLWHEEIVDWTAGLKSSMKKANTRASNSTKSHASVEVPTQVVSSKKKNILTDLRHRPLYDKTGKHADPYRDEGGLNLVANNYIKVNTSDLKTLPRNDITMMDNIQASPREGTDISLHHQLNNLKCPNQSHCIVPKLQLIPKFKIYLCKHPVKQGVRFYFISKEGFLLHPNVELLSYEDIELADYVMYLPGSAPWHRTECNDSSLANKLIVMDEFDGHGHFMPFGSPKEMIRAGYNLHASSKNEFLWYFMYFKRSYIVRKNGALRNFPHLLRPDFYPITYSLAEAYVRPVFNFNREMEIVCTLRGSPQQPARKRVQTWVEEYVKERSIEKAVVGQINTASRTTVSKKYFDLMHNAMIIVTVNPSEWEGDFRLWESMATGALIFVDPIFAPHPYPLIDGEHLVLFSNSNKSDLWHKLDYYRNHPDEARRVAINGYLHCMKYHRTVSMIDYVLRSAHIKSAIGRQKEVPNYTYSAQFLLDRVRRQRDHIIASQRPGIYND